MCDHCGCRDLTPVARLMSEHDRLRELSAEIRRSLAAHDEPAAHARFEELLLVLGPHVLREERALFPRLRREEVLADHVASLEAEHAGLYDAVDALDLESGPGCDGMLAVLDDLAEHIYKEDFGLFPAALQTLDGADWDAVDQWAEEQETATA